MVIPTKTEQDKAKRSEALSQRSASWGKMLYRQMLLEEETAVYQYRNLSSASVLSKWQLIAIPQSCHLFLRCESSMLFPVRHTCIQGT